MAAGTPKRRVVLAMDGSEYADYAFNCTYLNTTFFFRILSCVHKLRGRAARGVVYQHVRLILHRVVISFSFTKI